MTVTPALGLRKPADTDAFGQDDFGFNSDLLDKAVAPVFNVIGLGAKGDGIADDQPAIQAAIDAMTATWTLSGTVFTGLARLYFPPGVYKLGAPLVFSKDACVYEGSRGALLRPAGAFDALRLTGRDCTIAGLVVDGSLNGAGFVGNGITVGYGGANSYQTRLVDCEIWNMRGHGLVWEQGACLVTQNLYVRSCNDGIRCTENFDDNNTGVLEADIVNCLGVGLNVKNNAGVPNNSSRGHVFKAIRIFGCAGGGAIIETRENYGVLSLENNGAQDLTLAATSRTNRIVVNGTPSAFNGALDLGQGNLISGSSSNDRWMDKRVTIVSPGSAAWSSNPVVNTGSAWIEVAVPGCLIGDGIVVSGGATGRQVLLFGTVSVGGQVRVSIRNDSGANIAPPATLYITVLPAS